MNKPWDRKNATAAGVAVGVWLLFTIAAWRRPGEQADHGRRPCDWVRLTVAIGPLLWRATTARTRRGSGSLLAGFVLWSLGETLWAYYDVQPGAEAPFPSIADLAWAVGYLPLWIALYLRYRSIEVRGGSGVWVALVAVGSIAVLVTQFILRPIISDPEYAGFEKFLSVLYPVGDLILLLGALMVSLAAAAGSLCPGSSSLGWRSGGWRLFFVHRMEQRSRLRVPSLITFWPMSHTLVPDHNTSRRVSRKRSRRSRMGTLP
jgi:hypothetical protein